MTTFLKSGSCSNCGQCCGTSGDSPFKKGWAAAQNTIRVWELNEAFETYPHLAMFGFGNIGDEIGPIAPTGAYKIKGTDYPYVWVEGLGVAKDTSPGHDGSSYNSECPFLLEDPGDGTRPCALAGSQDDGARKQYCRPEEMPEYDPGKDIWSEYSKNQWVIDHNECTYTFDEVIP